MSKQQATAVASSAEANTYKGRLGGILSMVGMCVGLGNMWRFPYLCGQNGGGAFVFAYILCLIVVVIPLALVEAAYGKGIRGGIMDAFNAALKNEKAGKVIGGIFSVLYSTMNFYFIAIMGTCLYFIYASARSLWNTVPAEEIYPQSLENMPLMVSMGVILTILVGVIVYRGASKGIEKVSNIMMPLMFLFFAIVIILAAVTIPGIGAGYDFYLNPDWSALGNFDVWVAAMGQALFSVGVGPGCVYIYGTYFKKKDDMTVNITTVCVWDTIAALLAGMAIIPACIALGHDPESGARLIFIVWPSLLSNLPLGNVFGILVFTGIFVAGITSAVAQMVVAVETFSSGLKFDRKKVSIIATAITLVGVVISVYSEYFLNFFSDLSGNYGFIVTAGIGSVVYVYVYGVRKIRENFINPSSDVKLGPWFDFLVRFIAVPIMVVIMINSIVPIL
ncbi:MAG: sodium-dependent transporter [Clostridiales Family XIII bacterium]|jgi:NSS family neurotransmitter:Na+ symporter|nr:sodium-dependent transporter [Clostridiales Family XIII bacterium]